MNESPQTASPAVPAPLPLADLAAMVRKAMADGRWADTRLGGHVAAYLDALEYREASTNTLAAYEYVLALFCVEHADLHLADLEPRREPKLLGRSSTAIGGTGRRQHGGNGWRSSERS